MTSKRVHLSIVQVLPFHIKCILWAIWWICEIEPRGFGKALACRASFNNLKGNESSDVHQKNKTRVTLLNSFLKSLQCPSQVHHLKAIPPTAWGNVPPSNRPLCLCPYCWVPATVNGHLMILQGPFNWVENVQVGRAQPRLLKETKSLALHSHRQLRRAHTDTKRARTQQFSHTCRHICCNENFASYILELSLSWTSQLPQDETSTAKLHPK